jgi:hypothetical protein
MEVLPAVFDVKEQQSPRIDEEKERELKLGQIIALRFASDAELLNLMDRAIAEKITAKEIKQQIKNWKGDYLRV